VTDEKPELVDKWMADVQPTYPVVILGSGDFESFLEVKFFPTAAVITPEGELSFSGSSSEVAGPLSEAMSRAKKGSLWPKSLSKVVKALEAGKTDAAYGALLKLLDGGKLGEADGTIAGQFRSYLEGQAALAHEAGRKLLDEGFAWRAAGKVELYAEAKTPFPASADCAALLAEIAALPSFKKEMKGGELFAEAEALLDERDYTAAIKAWVSITKKCKGTRIAEHARARAAELARKGMAGYKSTCERCQQAKQACSKHAETVKL